MRCSGRFALLASIGVTLAAPASAQQSQLLETSSPSLGTYKATDKTKVGDVRPLASQRGVTLDGALRAAPMLPMHVAANPFENTWVGHEKQGDLRLDIGTYGPSEVDIALPANGPAWLVGRTYNARQTDSGGSQFDSDGPLGRNWALSSQPVIVLYDDADNTKDVLYLVYRADAYVEFGRAGSSSTEYKAKNGAAGCFHYASGSPDTWVYTDQQGFEFTFLGFNTSGNIYNGLFWKVADPDGHSAYVGDSSSASTAISNGWDGSGRITKAFDPSDRRFSYAYTSTSYGGKTRLESVIVETKSGGTWASPTGLVEIARVEYSYYGSETHGDGGDLKTVTVTTPLNNSSGESPSTNASQVKKKYYRYWEGSSDGVSAYNSSTNPGYVHELKYVLDFEGVRRYDWLDSTFDDDQLSASDDDLRAYAADYFEYDSSRRVRSAWFNGQCGCSGGASGTYTYTFDTNGSFVDGAGYDTAWATRTVVAKPDGSYLTQYFDELGQGLSSVVTDIVPTSSSPAPKTWVTSIVRDSNGCTTEIRMPDNLNASGYNHSTGAITAGSGAGLVRVFTRTSSGDLTGFVTEQRFKQGTSGTAYYEGKTSWDATTLTKTITDVKVVRPLVSATRSYPAQVSSDTGYEETGYSYTAWSSTLMPETITTTLPTVTTGNNGSGSALTRSAHYRKDGRIDWVNNEDATIDYIEYANGQETARTQDVDTGSITEPTGFTSSGGALQQKTVSAYTTQGMLSSQTTHALDATPRRPQTYRSRLADERMIVLHFPDFSSGSPSTYFGPVRFEVLNQAGKSEVSGVIKLTSNSTTSAESAFIDESQSDPLAAIDLGSVGQMRTTIHDESGTRASEERAYFLVPGSGVGTEGTNYDSTRYGYDGMGRRWRVKEASGTIRRTVVDAIGRQSESWMGTNDHGWSGGESSGSDNMVKTTATVYDGGSDNQNSLVTETKAFVEGSTTGQRLTDYLYDLRGRRIVTLPPSAPYTLTKFDNEGHVIATGQYSSSSGLDATDDPTSLATNRMALFESVFDELGRVWKSIRHKIDQADGSDDDTLNSLTWYDPRGRVIKVRGEEYRKTAYDRLGRVTDQYVLSKDNDSAYSDLFSSGTTQVAGDIVLEQDETRYDGTKPDVLLSVMIQRAHYDLDTGSGETTGALDTDADADNLKLTATNLKGRAQITASLHDQFGRVTDTVQLGTYSGADFDCDGLSAPARSDLALRTTTVYNTDGTVDTVTDPRALVTKYLYDALGRRTKEVKNYDSGVNSGNPYSTDQNVTVAYGYTNGLRTSLTAVMENTANNQVTTYIHGTTAGTPSAMKVSTGHLVRGVKYPDSTNGGTTSANIDSDSSDVVSYAYNAQGQETYRKDQAGTVLETVFDTSGRRTSVVVSAVGSGVDTAVRRTETGYDSLGRTISVVQYNATSGGSATDGVAWTFDDWGNLASYAEDRDSAVSGGGNQYTTSYVWEKATAGRYTLRLSTMTLPDSRVITYTYRSLGGLHDDEASRVSGVVDVVTVAQYDYLGVGTVVRTKLYDIGCMSRVYNDSTPPAYVDLDLFNRITTSRWTKDLGTDRDFYQEALTYDRDSNITSAVDGVHGAYHSAGAGWDRKFSMDNVNRLTQAEEGTLSGGSITSKTRDEQWTLSHTGNWDREKLDLNGDGDFVDTNELDDTRTHNAVNELLARDTDSNSSNNYTLAFDAAGNMTDDGKDYEYVYDAWNRLRKVNRTDNQALVAEYRYNALSHRIGVHEDTDVDGDVDANDKWYFDAFDEHWRQLARYRESDTSPKEDFVPHQAGASGHGGSSYIDLVICRNNDANTGWTSASDGTLEERNYLCQNWRADVSAIITSGGVMKEWVKYSAYGTPTGLPGGDTDSDGDCDGADVRQVQTWIDAPSYDVRGDIDLDGDVDATDKSTINNNYSGITLGRGVLSGTGVVNRKGYAGYEALSGLAGGKWLARNRMMSGEVGRWGRREPRPDRLDTALYAYCRGRAMTRVDPTGEVDCQAGDGGCGSAPSIGDYVHTWLAAQDAWDRSGKSGYRGAHNGPNDAFRHCYWACEAMRRTDGSLGAAYLVFDHENEPGNPPAERDMDEHNNKEGIYCYLAIKLGNGTYSGCGGDDDPSPGEFTPYDCERCCQNKLSMAELNVLPKREWQDAAPPKCGTLATPPSDMGGSKSAVRTSVAVHQGDS